MDPPNDLGDDKGHVQNHYELGLRSFGQKLEVPRPCKVLAKIRKSLHKYLKILTSLFHKTKLDEILGKHNRSDRISQTPRPRNKTDTILNHGIGQTDF